MNHRYPYFFSLGIFLAVFLVGCRRPESTTPSRKTIVDAVFASGKIITEDEYMVTANTEGYLAQRLVNEGDSVQTGNPLFLLSSDVQSAQLATAQANYKDALQKLRPESPQLVQLEMQIEQAQTQLEIDEKNYTRYKKLVQANAISQVDYENAKLKYTSSQKQLNILKASLEDLRSTLQLNLENAENQLKIQQENHRDYSITSSIKGQVLNIYKKQGDYVKRGETIAEIGGGKHIIKLYVAEEDINRIHLQQRTLVTLNTNVDQPLEAKISKIYPAFDVQEQSFIVEATFIIPPDILYPGTQLQANIVIDERKDALVIPVQYLLEGDSVMKANRTKIALKTGIKSSGWVEVLSGLTPEDKIIYRP